MFIIHIRGGRHILNIVIIDEAGFGLEGRQGVFGEVGFRVVEHVALALDFRIHDDVFNFEEDVGVSIGVPVVVVVVYCHVVLGFIQILVLGVVVDAAEGVGRLGLGVELKVRGRWGFHQEIFIALILIIQASL